MSDDPYQHHIDQACTLLVSDPASAQVHAIIALAIATQRGNTRPTYTPTRNTKPTAGTRNQTPTTWDECVALGIDPTTGNPL